MEFGAMKGIFLLAVSSLFCTSAHAADFVSVRYRNDSNIPVELGVRMVNGQYRWDRLAPGESGRTNVQFRYFVPVIDGAQRLGIALRTRNGNVRTGTLPVHISYSAFGEPFGYVVGRVIRRSPGVPGIVDAR